MNYEQFLDLSLAIPDGVTSFSKWQTRGAAKSARSQWTPVINPLCSRYTYFNTNKLLGPLLSYYLAHSTVKYRMVQWNFTDVCILLILLSFHIFFSSREICLSKVFALCHIFISITSISSLHPVPLVTKCLCERFQKNSNGNIVKVVRHWLWRWQGQKRTSVTKSRGVHLTPLAYVFSFRSLRNDGGKYCMI